MLKDATPEDTTSDLDCRNSPADKNTSCSPDEVIPPLLVSPIASKVHVSSVLIYLRYFILSVVALLIWDSPFGAPFALFATMVHEVGHYATAIATGGSVYDILVRDNASGHVLCSGGLRWVVIPAGYISTLVVGSYMLRCSSTDRSRKCVLIMGTLLLLYFGGEAADSAEVFFALCVSILWMLGALLSAASGLQILTVRTLGLLLCIDGTNDFHRLLTHSFGPDSAPVWSPVEQHPRTYRFSSDATLMAYHYGGTAGGWLLQWLCFSATIVAWNLHAAVAIERRQLSGAPEFRKSSLSKHDG